MLPARVDIVIVNWNGQDYCAALLPQIIQKWHASLGRVIVVDNASVDGSQAFITQNFPWVHLVRMTSNVGYAKGNNEGLKHCVAEIVLLLNNDTEVIEDDYLEKVIASFWRNPRAGVIGGRLRLRNGQMQTGAAGFDRGLRSYVDYFLFLSRFFPRITKPFYIDQDQCMGRGTVKVDWVSGAAMAARLDVLRMVGGVPEDFFMYAEDILLCRKVRQAGHRVLFDPGFCIVHFHGGSETAQQHTKTRWIDSTLAEYARGRSRLALAVAQAVFALGFLLRAAVYGGVGLLQAREGQLAQARRMLFYARAALRMRVPS